MPMIYTAAWTPETVTDPASDTCTILRQAPADDPAATSPADVALYRPIDLEQWRDRYPNQIATIEREISEHRSTITWRCPTRPVTIETAANVIGQPAVTLVLLLIVFGSCAVGSAITGTPNLPATLAGIAAAAAAAAAIAAHTCAAMPDTASSEFHDRAHIMQLLTASVCTHLTAVELATLRCAAPEERPHVAQMLLALDVNRDDHGVGGDDPLPEFESHLLSRLHPYIAAAVPA